MQVKVDINKVEIVQTEQINSGEYNTRQIQFNIAENMQGLILKALFTKDYKTYEADIENDSCMIPWEALECNGNCELGVYAYSVNGEVLEIRYSPEPTKFYINAGSYKTEVENGEQPTPTRSEVLEGKIKELDNKKVDKKEGYGLSQNDFTNELKDKLDNLNTQDDKVVKGHYDEENKQIILELQSGNKIAIPVNDLLDDFYVKQTIDNLLKEKQEQINYLDKTLTRAEASGENINIKNSAEYPISNISIDTNIKQDSREGYNDLPYPYLNTTKTLNGITFTDNGDGTITANGTATANTSFFLLGNNGTQKEIPKGFLSGGINNNAQVRVVNLTSGKYTVLASSTGNEKEIDLSTYSTGYVEIIITNGTTVNNAVFKPMISKTSGKVFEQYGSMPSIEFPSEIKTPVGKQEVYVGNKNWCDISKLEEWTQGGITFKPTKTGFNYQGIAERTYTTGKIIYDNIPKGNYKVSCKSNINVFIWFYDKDDGLIRNISKITTNNPVSLNLDKDCVRYVFGIENLTVGQTYSGEVGDIQIELGETPTDYTPHQSQVQDLDLNEELLGKIYKKDGKWFKCNEFYKYRVTGNFYSEPILDATKRRFIINLPVDCLVCDTTHNKAYSNRYKLLANGTTWQSIVGFTINNVNGNKLYLYDENYNSLDGYENQDKFNQAYQKYLSQNETYFVFPLAKPIEEEITDETLLAQLNAIDKMHTYEGVTNIYTINENGISPVINMKYVKSPKVVEENLQAQIDKLKNSIISMGGNV